MLIIQQLEEDSPKTATSSENHCIEKLKALLLLRASDQTNK